MRKDYSKKFLLLNAPYWLGHTARGYSFCIQAWKVGETCKLALKKLRGIPFRGQLADQSTKQRRHLGVSEPLIRGLRDNMLSRQQQLFNI